MSQLLEYLTSGKYLLAVGFVLVALAQALRTGLGAWQPWFKTQLGGYVVGFGTTALVYFGTALQQGAAITWQLVSIALVMGFASGGKYQMVRDVVTKIRQGTTAAGAAKAALLSAAIVGAPLMPLALSSSCGPNVQPGISSLIKCAASEAVTAQSGTSVFQIGSYIWGLLRQGGSAIGHAIESAIGTYGPDIVACAIDSYPEDNLATPQDAGLKLTPNAPPPAPVALKHELLGKYFPGKTFDHGTSITAAH